MQRQLTATQAPSGTISAARSADTSLLAGGGWSNALVPQRASAAGPAAEAALRSSPARCSCRRLRRAEALKSMACCLSTRAQS